MAGLEKQVIALRDEVKAWEEREERRREQRRWQQQLELEEKRQQRQQRQEEEAGSTNPFSPASPSELLEESRARCAAAVARIAALEGELAARAADGEAATQEAVAAKRALEAEREHTAVLLGERNSFRQRADSLARELSRVATRSLSHSQTQAESQQQTAPLLPVPPRSFDEAAAQLAAARAEAQRLREELEEVKALGAASFSSAAGMAATANPRQQQAAAATGDNNGGRPPSLRTMAAGAAGVLRRKSSGSGLSLFRLNSREDVLEEVGSGTSASSTSAPALGVRRERSGSTDGREAELQRLLRSLTQSVQDKETQLGRQRERLRRLEAVVREQGLRWPEGWEGEGQEEEKEGMAGLGSGDSRPQTVDV
jgi:hypothetical protein